MFNIQYSIFNVYSIYIQFYHYTCYLAYANLLTYWLSYPKSRDAIASKNCGLVVEMYASSHPSSLCCQPFHVKNILINSGMVSTSMLRPVSTIRYCNQGDGKLIVKIFSSKQTRNINVTSWWCWWFKDDSNCVKHPCLKYSVF